MKLSRVLGTLACAPLSISLMGCVSTGAPKTSAQVVEDLQREARAIAMGRGYDGSQVFNGGSLAERETGTLRFTLKGSERYIAIGLCDEQCKDIDLGVFDKDGFEIGSDTMEDAIPITELNPEKDGIAIFRLKMIRCDLQPCRYGVGVYGE
ncbi:hypothetical protein [uncultured Erythrobacter sp.]|uniref:hypothetical protein n=1 Tax=uncultured Erythrobacter sp. TaxID=263913 RepID=UPI002614A194|nr:hypothetical protein [uncultured Erythrobacter sp.]